MKVGDVCELEIQDLAFGGKSISKLQNNFVVFIDGGLPGQKVEVKIKKKKKNFAEAKLLRVLQRSDDELDLEYQPIGGAPWARLPIQIQQQYKQKQVFDLFEKFAGVILSGKTTDPPLKLRGGAEGGGDIFDTYKPSPLTWGYRNKVEYSFGPTSEECIGEEPIKDTEKTKKIWKHTGFGLGFKRRGQFWMVESLEKASGLFDEAFESKLIEIESFCASTGLPVYNARTQEGFWRNLTVRKSFHQDQFLICIGTSPCEEYGIGDRVKDSLRDLLLDLFGDRIAGINWQESKSLGDSIRNFESRELLYGSEKIVEKINGLEFEISLDSFFQTNPKSAEKLYGLVCEYVQEAIDCHSERSEESFIQPDRSFAKAQDDSSQSKTSNPKSPLILDLFCGTGTIGQILKSKIADSRIIGVEIVPEAIEDAKQNAKRNNITGIEFFADDVGKFLKAYPEHQGKIDAVVLDPPRAGIAPKTLKKVIELGSQSIIYVSCNPATMARDTQTLLASGYQLTKLSLVDQFPHTSHVECVGVFARQDADH